MKPRGGPRRRPAARSAARPRPAFSFTRVGSGPPLLFVSGPYQVREGWEPIARPLAESFEVITFDFPGHGVGAAGGRRAQAFDRPEMFEDHVLALLDHLSIAPGDVTACGQSFGANLLRSLHLRRGVDFKALVLMGVSCPQLASYYRLFDRMMREVFERAGEAYAGLVPFWIFSPKWLGDHPIAHDFIRTRYRELFGESAAVRALQRAATADVERGIPEGRFRCRTVMIHGDEDALTPAKYARAYAAESGAVFCGIEGGHGFPAESPAQTLETLRRVLADG